MKTIINRLKTIVLRHDGIAIVCLFLASLLPTSIGAAPLYRPEKAQRSLNTDQYAVSVQKDNRIDIHTIDGVPIVDNAFPEITFANKKPRPLQLDHRRSTRVGISNALGKGNGLRFETEECIWTIATYPGQPFVTIDMTYTNTDKKSVKVTSLSPWTIGDGRHGKVFVGTDRATEVRVLQNATPSEAYARLVPETTRSIGHLAAQNMTTGEAIVLGFFGPEQGQAYTVLLEPEKDQPIVYRRFGAFMDFADGIDLAPGEQIQTGTVYLAFQEQDAATGLERFVSMAKRFETHPERDLSHRHGWHVDPDSANEATLLKRIERLAAEGAARLGWSHIDLGTTWMNSTDALVVDPERFPNGLEVLSAAASQHGLSLGLTIPHAAAHGEALTNFLLDCHRWGIQAIEISYGNADSSEVVQPKQLYEALRAVNYGGPKPVSLRDGVVLPSKLAAWSEASRQYYLPPSGYPTLCAPGNTYFQDSTGFTDSQFVTAYSLAALQGSNLRPTTPFSELSGIRRQVLSQLVPNIRLSAHPLDLMEDSPPGLWTLPLKTDAGTWTVLGLFNWSSETSITHRSSLARVGLNGDVRYTVYDFWAGRYLGQIIDTLQVEVPPEGVRILGLRYVEQRPMLVASNRDFSQGASDHREITWSHEEQTLRGRFDGTEGFPYTLTFHLPDPYRLKGVTCDATITKQSQEESIVTLSLTPESAGEITWQLAF